LGTYVPVLFGCESVAVSVLFDAHQGLMQVALAWGIGVTLAIYLIVREVVAAVNLGCITATPLAWRCLSPGRPNPTHRYDHVVTSRSLEAIPLHGSCKLGHPFSPPSG